jgi:hypothetical protein
MRDISSRLNTLVLGMQPLTRLWLLQIALIGYGLGLLKLPRLRAESSRFRSLLFVALLDLPIEVVLAGVSRFAYPHYYITMLPALALFSSFGFWVVLRRAPAGATCSLSTGALALVYAGIFLGISILSFTRVDHAQRQSPAAQGIVAYIDDSTLPDESVMVWGANLALNYASGRRSPSRFAYLTPLYQANYTNEEMVAEFLEDLIKNRPALIIDGHDPTQPMYKFPIDTPRLRSDIGYLKGRYESAGTYGNWSVYRYVWSQRGP